MRPDESILKTLVFNLIKLKRRAEALHVVKEFQHNAVEPPEHLVAKILVSIVEAGDTKALSYMKTLAGMSTEVGCSKRKEGEKWQDDSVYSWIARLNLWWYFYAERKQGIQTLLESQLSGRSETKQKQLRGSLQELQS